MPGNNNVSGMGHKCCAEKLERKIEEIRGSQIRMEQKAKSSWDPAAVQTWRSKSTINKIIGGLVVVSSMVVLVAAGLSVVLTVVL